MRSASSRRRRGRRRRGRRRVLHRGRPVMVPAAAGRPDMYAVPRRGVAAVGVAARRRVGGVDQRPRVDRAPARPPEARPAPWAGSPWPRPRAPPRRRAARARCRRRRRRGAAPAARPLGGSRDSSRRSSSSNSPASSASSPDGVRADLRGRRLEGIQTGGERRERLAARLVAPAGEPALQLAEMRRRHDRRQRPLARPRVAGRPGAGVAEQRPLQERRRPRPDGQIEHRQAVCGEPRLGDALQHPSERQRQAGGVQCRWAAHHPPALERHPQRRRHDQEPAVAVGAEIEHPACLRHAQRAPARHGAGERLLVPAGAGEQHPYLRGPAGAGVQRIHRPGRVGADCGRAGQVAVADHARVRGRTRHRLTVRRMAVTALDAGRHECVTECSECP